MAHEHREQLELEGGQGHVALLVRDGPLREVDRHLIVGIGLLTVLAVRASASKQRLDARDQLLPPERLDHVVVRAGLQAAHPLELRTARRQHQHRHVREVPDAVQRLPAVELRHRDVEHDEVGGRLVEGAQPGSSVGSLIDLEPGTLQELGHEPTNVVVVVDDQDARRVHTAFIPGRGRVFYP